MNHSFPFIRPTDTFQPAADPVLAAPVDSITLSDHENRLHFFDRIAQTARLPARPGAPVKTVHSFTASGVSSA